MECGDWCSSSIPASSSSNKSGAVPRLYLHVFFSSSARLSVIARLSETYEWMQQIILIITFIVYWYIQKKYILLPCPSLNLFTSLSVSFSMTRLQISLWMFNTAKEFSLSSPIVDLMKVLSLFKVEKPPARPTSSTVASSVRPRGGLSWRSR